MLGGYKEGYGATPCTFSFDLVALVWRYLGPMPVSVQRAAAAVYQNLIVLFGRIKEDGTINGKTYVYGSP